MDIVRVNTNKTRDPSGMWDADPNNAAKCDYLVEERHGKVHAVYEFTGVSKRNSQGRFSFKGLKNITSTQPGQYIKENLDVSRVPGESNPVQYDTI